MTSHIVTDDATLTPISFSDVLKWPHEDHLAAFNAFVMGGKKMQSGAYKTRKLGISGLALRRLGALAMQMHNPTPETARVFFEEEFVPHRITPKKGAGFVTGFFEPLVQASHTWTEEFSVPLFRRPPELIDIDDQNRPMDMDSYFRFGQMSGNGIEEYFDRGKIQSGALEGRELELAWLKNKIDAFFIHVQGSAKLKMQNGEVMRITYAAKSGHPYTSVAKTLCKQIHVDAEKMTADRLADWMYAHPDQIDDLLAHNRSYIFFKKVENLKPDDGPVAAAKIPLLSGRSLAVDKSLHTFGCPIWLTTSQPLPNETKPFARLMFAHDTGSAITGPARGDIFMGTGKEAGLIAGKIRHEANFTVLVPKS